MAGSFTEGRCNDCKFCDMAEKWFTFNQAFVDAYCISEMGPDGPINSGLSPYANYKRFSTGLVRVAEQMKKSGKTCLTPRGSQ